MNDHFGAILKHSTDWRPSIADGHRSVVPEEGLHLLGEDGHLVRDHVPYDVEVDAEVGVDQDVTQARDLGPFDLWGALPFFGPEPVSPLRR